MGIQSDYCWTYDTSCISNSFHHRYVNDSGNAFFYLNLRFIFFLSSALELVGPNYRSFVTVMTCTFYTFGLMALALVTVFVRDWFMLSLVTSVPFLLYFLYMFIMPESPRWLLAKGKLEDALKVLETMARVNGKEFPESFHSKLEERVLQEKSRKSKKKERTIGALDLCK